MQTTLTADGLTEARRQIDALPEHCRAELQIKAIETERRIRSLSTHFDRMKFEMTELRREFRATVKRFEGFGTRRSNLS